MTVVTLAYGWENDLRYTEENSSNVFLTPGEEVDFVLGGTAGTGGQWMYGLTNQFVLGFVD